MSPEARYDAARYRMIERQLRARGVRDERVLDAILRIPREDFLPEELRMHAYEDRAVGIGRDQTISQPYMVASMTERLRPAAHHRVLEIGTGSGYQAAILALLAGHVYTVERIPELLEQARERLTRLGLTHVSYRVGDGTLGWPDEAPFDRIMVTAGTPIIPASLTDQLAEGGRMVIPVGPHEQQILTVVERRNGKTVEYPDFACRFVKLIGENAWEE